MIHLIAYKNCIEEERKERRFIAEESQAQAEESQAQVIAKLLPVNADHPLSIDILLNYSEWEEGWQWRLDEPKYF